MSKVAPNGNYFHLNIIIIKICLALDCGKFVKLIKSFFLRKENIIAIIMYKKMKLV